MLYRGMDRAQLGAAYNGLAAVPSAPNLLADGLRAALAFVSGITGISASLTASGRVKGSIYSLQATPQRRPSRTFTAVLANDRQRTVQRLGPGCGVARSQTWRSSHTPLPPTPRRTAEQSTF